MKRIKDIDLELPWWREHKAYKHYLVNHDEEIYHDVYAGEDYFVFRCWKAGGKINEYLLTIEEFVEFKLTGTLEEAK